MNTATRSRIILTMAVEVCARWGFPQEPWTCIGSQLLLIGRHIRQYNIMVAAHHARTTTTATIIKRRTTWYLKISMYRSKIASRQDVVAVLQGKLKAYVD